MITDDQQLCIDAWQSNPYVHRLDVLPPEMMHQVGTATCHMFQMIAKGNKRQHSHDYELIAVGNVDPDGAYEVHIPSPVEMSTITPIMETA